MRELPIGATGGACYPAERFQIREGWQLEVTPLTLGRARIIHTDGVSVDDFW